MRNTAQALALPLLILTILSSTVFAQTYRDWSKPEQLLAEILLRDTTSRMVSYLPKGYWFGLTDRSHGYLKLVKKGGENYLLRDGTHQVFLLRKDKGNMFLDRQDSSVFYGDNFLSMTFLRKDTIYQYGGYGFWNTRDFFMYYRNSNQDWEFLTGGNGLPNELNYHWYDAKEDAFYIIGSLHTTHHPLPHKKLVDSIYRYDFATHQWTAIGRVQDNFSEMNLLWKLELPVCFTPFGYLDTRTSVLKLHDIPGNRILSPKGKLADFLLKIGRSDPLYSKDYRHFIVLNDTLHIIRGTNEKVEYATIGINMSDYDLKRTQTLYLPIKNKSTLFNLLQQPWIFSLAIPLTAAGYYLRNRRRKKAEPEAITEEAIQETGEDEGIAESNAFTETNHTNAIIKTDDLAFFKSQLNPTELELLDMLLKTTQAGSAADIISINKTLGVANKDASLQKARRSISINNINSCFRQILKVEDNLIIRARDEDDKRAFVYTLNPTFIDRLI